MVIAVDFDGTCVTHEYPDVGKNIGAEIVLKALTDEGHDLILYTMRDHPADSGVQDPLQEAIDWFSQNDIPLFGVNENPTQKNWTTSPKPYANLYIDDAALGMLTIVLSGGRPFVDWYATAFRLGRRGVLSEEKSAQVLERLLKEYPELYDVPRTYKSR